MILKALGLGLALLASAVLLLVGKARRDLHAGHITELRRLTIEDIKRKEHARAQRRDTAAWLSFDGATCESLN